MKLIHADFNTLTSELVGLVKYLQRDGQPPPQDGECVVLYDADGLEVQATIELYITARGEAVFVAAPDEETWHDTVPQDISPLLPEAR